MALHDFVARLFALAALDLRIDLVSASVEQVDGPILQRPQVAVQAQVFVIAYPLARDHLRGLEPHRCCLYRYRLRLCRAGRQEEAEQPSHEQVCCCA